MIIHDIVMLRLWSNILAGSSFMAADYSPTMFYKIQMGHVGIITLPSEVRPDEYNDHR